MRTTLRPTAVPDAPAVDPRGVAGRVFLDRERRPRVGWRLLTYLILVVAATGGLSAVFEGASLAARTAVHMAAVTLVVAITYVFRRFVDRRPWRDIGLTAGRRPVRAAAAGFGGGLLAMGGFFATAWALGWARVTGTELAERGLGGVTALLAAGVVMYGASSVFQEVAFRGYFFQNLAEAHSVRWGAIVSSVIFAALHFPDGASSPLFAVVLLVDLTAIACFFVLTRLRTGALWMAIGFHTGWNWAMDNVFSLDTAAGRDYGNALIHVRLHGPSLGLGQDGGVELLYAVTSTLVLTGYWLFTRGRAES
jgi:membrane protease YdiL (CAAX protease family)